MMLLSVMHALHSPYRQIERAIVDAIVWLVVLVVLKMVLSVGLARLAFEYQEYLGVTFFDIVMYNTHWVSNICFGTLLMVKLRNRRTLAISVGALGVMSPVFAGVFYVLVKTYGDSKFA